jgi:signal transduction histidine kinase/CheY-like chemotaxis protein/ferredoxin
VESASVAFRDERGDIRVRVDAEKCISCGKCVSVCKHGARRFADDTQRFFDDLMAGETISVITAPAIKTNFPRWRSIIAWLRTLGVARVYDVSLGADICTWAHLRYIEKYDPDTLISQPCPCVVTYIEKHRPELIKYLSPVQSPMGCLAVYMREYAGERGRIAAFSPCIAKSDEFTAIGAIEYNITFASLYKYLEDENIILPGEQSGFDRDNAGLGAMYPAPGGLKETIEYFTGNALRVDTAEGKKLYRLLDEYEQTPVGDRPKILDGLNCEDGCNFGSACVPGKSVFSISAKMYNTRRDLHASRDFEHYRALYEEYDAQFDLTRFFREYRSNPLGAVDVAESEIQAAMLKMGKDTYAKQNFNCGACGSETCREMARKIVLGVNLPDNCAVKAREDLLAANRQNDVLYRRNKKYIKLLHDIGETLADVESGRGSEVMTQSLAKLARALGASGAQLWRYVGEDGGYCERLFDWSGANEYKTVRLTRAQLPGWIETYERGESVLRGAGNMTPPEKRLFIDRGIRAVLSVPIRIDGALWGAATVLQRRARKFADEEISLISAAGIFLASSAVEQELTSTLIAAREEALAGAQAKTDFLSRMSHEIRTPMNAIIGMTKIAESTDELKKLRHCFTTIDAASTHLLGILNDVLDMAKIEAGKLTLDYAPLDIETMLIGICDITAAKMAQKRINFNVIMDSSMRTAYIGDELRLSQVVTNLLSNAVKFTPEGGRVTVVVTEIAQEGISSTLRFLVEDTGIGIDREGLTRLFSPFEQANKGITQRFGGTGLGLSISKSIVESMDGTIWATSSVGEGSKFYFEITLTWDETVHDVAAEKMFRALVIDTNRDSRDFHGTVRRMGALDFTFVYSSEEAVTAMTTARDGGAPYDAVVADYDMADVRRDIGQLRVAAGDARFVVMAPFENWGRIESELHARDMASPLFVVKPLFKSALLEVLTSDGTKKPADDTADELYFPGKRLLLVEDVDINREIFITLLEGSGIEIDEAENGRIGLEKFRAAPDKYDAIIMDIQMPEMNGLQASRAIRELDALRAPTVPIIAMTANAFREDIEACLEAGMNDHLMKPIDLDALGAKLKEYLR